MLKRDWDVSAFPPHPTSPGRAGPRACCGLGGSSRSLQGEQRCFSWVTRRTRCGPAGEGLGSLRARGRAGLGGTPRGHRPPLGGSLSDIADSCVDSGGEGMPWRGVGVDMGPLAPLVLLGVRPPRWQPAPDAEESPQS